MKRVVLDTNIIISSALGGALVLVLERWGEEKFTVVVTTMTLQLIEAGLPVLLLVNIIDEAERVGMRIDIALLEEKLGIPVVGAAICRKRGINELRQALAAYQPGKAVFAYAADLEQDIQRVAALIRGNYRLDPRCLALLLLQRDEELQERVRAVEEDNSAAITACSQCRGFRAAR